MSQKEMTTYHIYGRTDYAQPLTFVTAVTVPANGQPPQPTAAAGESWVELIAFPETAVCQVIPRPKEKAA